MTHQDSASREISAEGALQEQIFQALGDQTRRRIFDMIREKPRCVSEIATQLPISQPAVSQHLRVLREAGLVRVERQGRQRIYHCRPEGFEPLRAYVSSFWDGALGAFQSSFQNDNKE